MKKLIVAAALLALAAGAAQGGKKVYTEEEKAALKEKRLQKTGGIVLKEGEGRIVVVNAQGKFSAGDIERALAPFRDFLKVRIDVRDGKWSFGDGRPNDADVALFVVEDASLPMSLVAMEGRWGVVNVAALGGGKQFDSEFARVGIATFGAGVSQYKVSPMQPVFRPSDLDGIVKPAITMDAGMAMNRNLEKAGVTKSKMTTYLKACQEGWAPAPTNDYQKAIWEETRKLPEKPLQIKFDPKKGR